MFIRYKLYRSKYPDQVFNAEKIQWNLQTDKDIIEIDKRLTDLLSFHISNLPQIKKFGTGYIDRMEIVSLEITDEDYTSYLSEEQFRTYMANENVMPYITIIWSKTNNNS